MQEIVGASASGTPLALRVSAPEAYLAYNSKDRQAVRRIEAALRGMGIRTWVDFYDFPKKGSGMQAMSDALGAAQSIIVFFGPNSTGPIQKREIDYAVRNEEKAIVVLLPGATSIDPSAIDRRLNLFCGFYHHKFETDDDEEALLELKRAIRGAPPEKDASSKLRRLVREDAAGYLAARGAPGLDDSGLDFTVDYELLADVKRRLLEAPIVLFVGSHAIEPETVRTEGAYRMAQELLRRLEVLHDNEPPGRYLPCLSSSSLVFAARHGGEDRLHLAMSEFIEPSVVDIPDTHDRIAELIATLHARRQPERMANLRFWDAIVTTTIDPTLEIGLLQRGLPFKQLIFDRHRAAIRYCKFQIEGGAITLFMDSVTRGGNVSSPERGSDLQCVRDGFSHPFERSQSFYENLRTAFERWEAEHDDFEWSELRTVMANGLDSFLRESGDRDLSHAGRLLLVRLNGICVIPSSYLITADHYLDAIINEIDAPTPVRRFIFENNKLIVNYNLLDMEFRYLYFRLFGGRNVSAAEGKCLIVQDPRIVIDELEKSEEEGRRAADDDTTGTGEARQAAATDEVAAHYARKLGAAATWNVVQPGHHCLPSKLSAEIIHGSALAVLGKLVEELAR